MKYSDKQVEDILENVAAAIRSHRIVTNDLPGLLTTLKGYLMRTGVVEDVCWHCTGTVFANLKEGEVMSIESKIKEIVRLVEAKIDPDGDNASRIQVCHDEEAVWVNMVLEYDCELLYRTEVTKACSADQIANEALTEIGYAIGQSLL